jgi:Protein of unknown function (DUF551)
MMEWISNLEDLPELHEVVLVCDNISGFVCLGRLTDEDEEEHYFEMIDIAPIECDSVLTHWMPLPKPPID